MFYKPDWWNVILSLYFTHIWIVISAQFQMHICITHNCVQKTAFLIAFYSIILCYNYCYNKFFLLFIALMYRLFCFFVVFFFSFFSFFFLSSWKILNSYELLLLWHHHGFNWCRHSLGFINLTFFCKLGTALSSKFN